MSRRHGGRSAKGAWKKRLAWSGWIVLILVLGGHWIFAETRKTEEGTPQGVVSPEHLRAGAFWVPLLVGAVMSIAGMYWASKAHDKNPRSSLLWLRRGFVVSLVGAVVLGLACFDPDTFPREWLAAVAAAIFGGQTLMFALASFREHRRGEFGESRRGMARAEHARAGADVEDDDIVPLDVPSREA